MASEHESNHGDAGCACDETNTRCTPGAPQESGFVPGFVESLIQLLFQFQKGAFHAHKLAIAPVAASAISIGRRGKRNRKGVLHPVKLDEHVKCLVTEGRSKVNHKTGAGPTNRDEFQELSDWVIQCAGPGNGFLEGQAQQGGVLTVLQVIGDEAGHAGSRGSTQDLFNRGAVWLEHLCNGEPLAVPLNIISLRTAIAAVVDLGPDFLVRGGLDRESVLPAEINRGRRRGSRGGSRRARHSDFAPFLLPVGGSLLLLFELRGGERKGEMRWRCGAWVIT